VVLDPAGFAISTAAKQQYDPVVAFDGTNYLVVWRDYRNGAGNPDIYGARVSQAGVVLDPAGIAISTASGDQSNPAIAFDGSNYVVGWMDGRSGTSEDVYACRVTPAGAVLEPSGVAIASGSHNELLPAISRDGSNFLFVWMDYRSGTNYDVYGARVTSTLAVLDAGGFLISGAAGNQQYPTAAFDGRNYLVVWEDKRGGTYYDIYGARVSPTASVLDPSGVAISTAAEDQWQPRLTYDGQGYLVVWMDDRSIFMSIYGSWVGTDATVYNPEGIPLETGDHDHAWPRVLADAGDPLLLIYSAFSAPPNYGTFRIWGDFVLSASGVDVTGPGPAGSTRFGFVDVRPNPFSRDTTVRFSLLADCTVRLSVYDVTGRKVAILADGRLSAGGHSVVWGGEDQAGRPVAAGIYFCGLTAGSQTGIIKVLLAK
jgi:YD repeat-containing protein